MRVAFLVITLLGVILGSCLTINLLDPSMSFKEIPSDVEPYVDRFIADYTAFAKANLTHYTRLGDAKESLIIRILKIDKANIVGLCTTMPGGFKMITLDSNYWYNILDEDQKEYVVYHELGHCLLGQDHREDEVQGSDGNVKLSMMSSSMIGMWTYTPRRGHCDTFAFEWFVARGL